MKVDDRKLYTDREMNVYIQGQLSILDILAKNIEKSGSWILVTFALPVIVETRGLMLDKYRKIFPKSDVS
jgi:hypothetical protein